MSFADALCAWFDAGHRAMPWRETRDPYRIWLSETMLQQTQVETVRGYYDRFLARFPNVVALAEADIHDVMKLWEGLGYYARCRNLHRAAGMVAARDGRFPDTLDGLCSLPGIGRSTAGAILTFGFSKPHPLLDGNVKRVLSRYFDETEPMQTAAVEKRQWVQSAQLLAGAQDAWTFNQAIMELGARVCTLRDPICNGCPVRDGCLSLRRGTVLDRPVRTKKAPVPHYDIGVGVLRDDLGRIFIQLRPPSGLLGGLWEFPGGKRQLDEPIETTVRRELEEELTIRVDVGRLIARVKHAYSHFKITLHAYDCTLLSGTPTLKAAVDSKWVRLDEIGNYAFPKANARVIDALR